MREIKTKMPFHALDELNLETRAYIHVLEIVPAPIII